MKTIIKTFKVTNNISKDNRLRNSGSNIENVNHKSTLKSNQCIFALILGDSMVKDDDGYFLMGSINRELIVKVTAFSTGKIIDIEDHTISTKRDFNPDLYCYM